MSTAVHHNVRVSLAPACVQMYGIWAKCLWAIEMHNPPDDWPAFSTNTKLDPMDIMAGWTQALWDYIVGLFGMI